MIELKKRGDGDATETPPLPQEKPKSRKKTQESVIIYITLLFAVAFLLILLSYFTHSRKSENEITTLTEEHTEFKLKAQQDISDLQSRNISLQTELEAAQSEAEELKKSLSDLNAASEQQRKEENEKYDALYKSLVAMDRLIDLEEAFRTGDEVLVEIAFRSMDEYGAYLEGQYKTLYEDMKANPQDYLIIVPTEEPAENEEEEITTDDRH